MFLCCCYSWIFRVSRRRYFAEAVFRTFSFFKKYKTENPRFQCREEAEGRLKKMIETHCISDVAFNFSANHSPFSNLCVIS